MSALSVSAAAGGFGKRWRPTKGGDGGAAPSIEAGEQANGTIHARANARVHMTCGDAGLTPWVETVDPNDRAHSIRDGAGRHVPARKLAMIASRARKYPPCHMTTGGVSYDSAAEMLDELEAELQRECGRPRHRSGIIRFDELRGLVGSDGIRLRDILEPNRCALRRREVEDEAEAEAWLAAHGG